MPARVVLSADEAFNVTNRDVDECQALLGDAMTRDRSIRFTRADGTGTHVIFGSQLGSPIVSEVSPEELAGGDTYTLDID